MKSLSPDNSFDRTCKSRLLCGLRDERRNALRDIDPALKMMRAFALSVEARRVQIAGLRSQGFANSEIIQILLGGSARDLEDAMSIVHIQGDRLDWDLIWRLCPEGLGDALRNLTR